MSEIERRRTRAADPADIARDGGELSQIGLERPELSKWEPCRDQRAFRLRHRRYLQARLVDPRSTAGPRAVDRISLDVVDHPCAHRTTRHSPNRYPLTRKTT